MTTRARYLKYLLAATCLSLSAQFPEARAEDSFMALVSAFPALKPSDQALPAAPGKGQAAEAVSAKAPDDVELAALYYYAEHNQEDRIQREAARLSHKYPGFVMPADLYQPASLRSVDKSSLWALYDKQDFAGIDAEIVRLKSEKPEWNPSADFQSKLERKKQRVLMEKAVAAKDWSGVINAGSNLDPKTEKDVDLLWNLIDAYHETGVQDALSEVYRGILFRPESEKLDDAALVTTLQKAVRDFQSSDVRAAMDKIGATPAMRLALKSISGDLIRKDIAEFNADLKRKDPLPETDIGQFREIIARQNKPEDLNLLGWYYLKILNLAESESWFARAMAVKPDEDNAKGLYLALANQKKDDQAWQVASAHLPELKSDPEFLMNALSIRFAKPDGVTINEEIVSSYSETIISTNSAAHAEILAWYAYNSGQFEASEAWFSKSFEWEESPDRLKGLALSFQREGKKAELISLKNETVSSYPAVWEEIKTTTAPIVRKGTSVEKPKVTAQLSYLTYFNAKNYSGCLSELNSIESQGRLGAEAQLIKGWCLMGLHRLAEARDAFAPALAGSGKTREDAAYGTALTLLRGKLTDDAEAILAAYPLGTSRDHEVRAEIYWQRARSAFDHKQYDRVLDALNARMQLVPEPANMSQLRAWSHYNLGHLAEAKAIFEKLNMHMSDAGISRGLNTTTATQIQ